MQPINPKITKRGAEARNAALEGIEVVYAAVSATLGPRSSNVGITRPFGRPAVVHDGVTVAKELLPLEDPFENYGAELAVEAADKTNSIGDGTTTATVLMRSIAKKANTYIAAGARPMALREGIEAATTAIVKQLDLMAIPISKTADVKRIATISAQNEEIGKMVADAYDELGKDGIMSVEESRGTDTFLEIKTGMEFDRGFRSPYFVTDPILGEATLVEPAILVTDYSLRTVTQLGPMLERLVNGIDATGMADPSQGIKEIVIIANEIDGEALGFLAVNHVKQAIRVIAVNAPSFGDKRTDILKDIAIVTGATFIGEQAGIGLDSVTAAHLGRAGRVTSTKDSTLIVDGIGSQEDVNNRAAEIKNLADNPDTGEFDREKLMERYAKIKSGVAVLTIGAKSEPEIKERKERAIDAISATKAALEQGIVPGGGIALIEAAETSELAAIINNPKTERDFLSGVQIVIDACQQPFRKLLSNAGFDPGSYIKLVGKGKGVNVVTGEVSDMVKAGIIDPVLVVKSALENASSNAVMVATTEVIIVEKPTKQQKENL